MKMIVGLGNPGIRYAQTRHNLGFLVIEALAGQHNIALTKKQNRALLGQGLIAEEKVLLVQPQTFMNKSGEAVWEIINYYGESLHDFIIVHDDLDLAWGQLRFKRKGGSGGHRGLSSLIKMLHSHDFPRLKIGLGRPPAFMTPEAYVLGTFSEKEKETLAQVIEEAVEGLVTWCGAGLAEAMQKFNSFAKE